MKCLDWFPTNLSSAHAVMQYNLAVAKAIKGQLEDANQLLKNILQLLSPVCQVPAHIMMLVVYIELRLGESQSCLGLPVNLC